MHFNISAREKKQIKSTISFKKPGNQPQVSDIFSE